MALSRKKLQVSNCCGFFLNSTEKKLVQKTYKKGKQFMNK